MASVIDQCVALLTKMQDESMSHLERFSEAYRVLEELIQPSLSDQQRQSIATLQEAVKTLIAIDKSRGERAFDQEMRQQHAELLQELQLFAEKQLIAAKRQLIQRLDQVPGKLPVEAMLEIRQHRELMIPELIARLERSAREIEQAIDLGPAKIVALYLLAEFRAGEALPSLMCILSLPDELVFEMFGDAVTEDMSTILAQLAPESLEVLDPLIYNTQASPYVRWEALEVYLHRVREGTLSRAEAIERLTKYLRYAIAKVDCDLATGAVYSLSVLGPREAIKDINAAFDLDLIRLDFISHKHVMETTSRDRFEIEEALNRRLHHPITDAIKELSSWACFCEDRSPLPSQTVTIPSPHLQDSRTARGSSRSATRPGRNDACPCGSGKKYKKCCALKVSE